MNDSAKLFPNEDGAVLCLKCRKEDSIYRNGVNALISVRPVGGKDLYIHKEELVALESNAFITLYYDALTCAYRGE
jgi:hypothetical protein